MPIFEEKLICPLSIRFTQRHIKTSFRDGRLVEQTLSEIGTESGAHGYDVVLDAPFPHIEIIRLSPQQRGLPRDHEDSHDDHWYSLDNRRLYCLQQAAAAHWPKRVAAVVQILYADTGALRRKLDSTTSGRSVSIAHSTKGPELGVWSWRNAVAFYAVNRGARMSTLVNSAMDGVRADESKRDLAELQDATSEPNSLMAVALGTRSCGSSYSFSAATTPATVTPKSVSSAERCPTPSTEEPDSGSAGTTPRMLEEPARVSLRCTAQKAQEPVATSAVMQALSGIWVGQRGETYILDFISSNVWNCVRYDAAGTKEFQISYEEAEGLAWWGSEKGYFLDATQLVSANSQVMWYAAGDKTRRKPRFVWSQQGSASQATPTWIEQAQDVEADQADGSSPLLAACAIREVTEQLLEQGGHGRVWLPHWNEHYRVHLGPLRDFLDALPDKFTVTAGQGARKYAVAIAGAAANAELSALTQSLTAQAVQAIEEQVMAPDSEGFVVIPDWKQRFSAHLGSIRSFLESQPDKFAIMPRRNGKFTVAMAHPEQWVPCLD